MAFSGISDACRTKTGQQTTIALLSAGISDLADHFGRAFSGNLESVAFSIFQNYGGLSVVDFMLLCDRAKSSRYRGEFQHIAAQGFTWELLRDWMEKFCEERETVRLADEAAMGEREPGGDASPEAVQRLIEARRRAEAAAVLRDGERRRVQAMADAVTRAWEADVFEVTAVETWFKTVRRKEAQLTSDGQEFYVEVNVEVICDAADPARKRSERHPVRREKEGGAERRLKREIHELVSFLDTAATLEIFAQIEAVLPERYGNDWPAVRDAEFRSIRQRLASARRDLSPTIADFVARRSLKKLADEGQISAAIAEHHAAISRHLAALHRGLENAFYDEYLPGCIERNYPPLTKDEFVQQAMLHTAISEGLSNPLLEVIR